MADSVQTFNSPIETGVRALILLAEAYPDQLDLQRILEFDYILVHTGDVDGPPSIHPALPLRSGELLVRRQLIERGLMLMISRGLVGRAATPNGFTYFARDEAGPFLDSLTAEFRFLLTGVDESAVTGEGEISIAPELQPEKPTVSPDTLAEMISDYETELAKLVDDPAKIDAEETAIEEELDRLQASIRNMEGRISQTSQQRKIVYDSYNRFGARVNEITELLERFKLLDAQYTNDIKRLVAIEESGQFFVLREPMACPLCGARPEGQHHDAACDGNVMSVTQAAKAEIAKIRVLQTELQGTVTALTKERSEGSAEQKTLAVQWRQFQSEIENALSPDFTAARKRHEELIERRANIRQADVLHKKIRSLRRRLDEPAPAAPKRNKSPEPEDTPDVLEYIPKTVLREFSQTVSTILTEWHFPDATDVYFDEVNRDVVIGGRLRGSRGAGLCAITYSSFTLALFEFCRARKMPHPGLVILDSPLIAYKEPKADDEGIAGTDLKRRFYEHLEGFAGEDQIFIVDNTEPPPAFIPKATHFTANPDFPRSGLFPSLKKSQTKV